MQVGIPKESIAGENRVAATPETVKKMVNMGLKVFVCKNAGLASSILNDEFSDAGATICGQEDAFNKEIVLKVRVPSPTECKLFSDSAILIGMLEPFHKKGIDTLLNTGITAFALEAAPRTTRAQTIDVLSSQANLSGYKAVLIAANAYPKLIPMLMTAAGSIKAAKVVVLGAGVAGLQAIATAKRLGAIVEASDVRPAVKEQIESLGAKFIDVPFETDEEKSAAEGKGGYAKAMPTSWLKRQQEEVAKRISVANIVITTALIPGKPAPVLVSESMVKSMAPGSVIVDMAVEQGGNCFGSKLDETVELESVTIIGASNLPASVPTDASALYARNILDFLKLIVDDKNKLNISTEDDIVSSTLIVKEGKLWKS